MVAVTGYQAGVESNATQLSYAMETAWGTFPGGALQAIRYTSETLAQNKTRQRPSEIQTSREASQAVTTQVGATGTINYAFSATTYDDFFASCLQNDWGTAQTIAGIAGDITLTNTAGVITLTSTLGTKFSALAVGQWIRLLGFTNAINNAEWYVSIKTDNSHLTLTGPNSATAVTETPALTAAQVRAKTIRNGTVFKTMHIQQQFSSALFLLYPGSYVSRMTMSCGVGNFVSGGIDVVAKSETTATSTAGSVTAAPTGRVFDPINGFVGAFWNEAALGTAVDQFALTLENTGASPEYQLGSSSAAGVLGGTFMASGTFRAYFKDFTLYTNFINETSGRLAFVLKDSSGIMYVFTFLSAVLLGKITAGGPNQPVYVEFSVEGGPSGSSSSTLVIDVLAAT